MCVILNGVILRTAISTINREKFLLLNTIPKFIILDIINTLLISSYKIRMIQHLSRGLDDITEQIYKLKRSQTGYFGSLTKLLNCAPILISTPGNCDKVSFITKSTNQQKNRLPLLLSS